MRKAAVILLLLMLGRAEAGISRRTVERAWQKISQLENLAHLTIHFEADDDPNAWVSWQDNEHFTVHVTTSLMEILNSESEIAGVLGHEIGHIKLEHYTGLVLSDTARAIMTANLERADELTQAVGNIDTDLRESTFSREQETEADNYGVQLLVKAGYDSYGLYNAMRRFDENGYGTEHSGFNSHPASRERLAHLAEEARKFSGSKQSSSMNDVDDIASVLMSR